MAEYQASRFVGLRTLNFVFNLRQSQAPDDRDNVLRAEKATELGRVFRRKLNQQLFGNRFRRFGIELPVTICLHSIPHLHLHGHIGLDHCVSELRVRTICQSFALKNPWVDPFPYIRETETGIGTERYNSRFGADSLIVF
jgi:hypothetical protein